MDESPVFQSLNGKRWKVIKISVAVLITSALAFSVYIIPQIFTVEMVTPLHGNELASLVSPRTGPAEPSIDVITEMMYRRNTPVIGEGPLIRVVRLVETNGVTNTFDPFSGSPIGRVSDAEKSKTQGYAYAIERYGSTSGKHIALTFDDGPDPVYSPQILDILSKEEAPSTFFVVGSNVAKYTEIVHRMEREGHILANHTFDHSDLEVSTDIASTMEINLTQRVIRAAAQTNPSFFRIPYGGNTDQTLRDSARGLLKAQQLGYIAASYDYDTNDWRFDEGVKAELPEFDGRDMVVLLHDSGGNRIHTVEYLKKFIAAAKAKGYSFVTLEQLYKQPATLNPKITASLSDQVTLLVSQAVLVLPKTFITYLFYVTIWTMFVAIVINVTLASVNIKRTRYRRRANHYNPKVTIIVPAYNEGKVLIGSVRSLLRSRYKNCDILIVDDGSTDDTWEIAKQLAVKRKRVRAIHQKNGGKATALNRGIKKAKGEIIIGIDADTIFAPSTVTRLIRHFSDPRVGAVAGSVKVGNIKNMLTRWQALEYTVSINIERNAQALLSAVMIVPGACGAWRKQALLDAGGYSLATLAEDCDLTLSVHRCGYRVLQDNSAVAYTEAPETLGPFVKQRFRWMFGSIQALWKHRGMIFDYRYHWLGLFTMPNTVTALLIPILFIPLLATVTIENILAGRILIILLFFGVTFALNFLIGFIGLVLARERFRYLVAVPYARFVFAPIRLYLLYKTVITAMKGAYVGWNKLQRTGSVAASQPVTLRVKKSQSAP